MSIAASSTDLGAATQPGNAERLSWTELRRSLSDLRALLAFRGSGRTPQQRHRTAIGVGILVGLTAAAVLVPALVDGTSRDVVALLSPAYLGFLALAVVGSIASAGGRELIPRDQAVAFPVSSLTDHLGALMMAPLNLAWLVQAWLVLGMTSFAFGDHLTPLVLVPQVLFIAFATAAGQAIGWFVEWIRRGRNGVLHLRLLGVTGVAVLAVAVVTGAFVRALDASPTVWLVIASNHITDHRYPVWLTVCGLLLAGLVAAVVLGALPARWASRRTPRDEHRLETGLQPPRPMPASDLGMLLRLDRGTVWRSVPLRRGVITLVVLPGLVALAGGLGWGQAMMLPGLVAAGCVLLFGVNTWCLDGRGMLWKESLPVDPGTVFAARLLVLLEVTTVGVVATLGIVAIRAGLPTLGEFVALLATVAAILGQVASASMRWSTNKPFAVDLRSARATPAPPSVMVGYSARLALSTTLTGMLIGGLGQTPLWPMAAVLGMAMVTFSLFRLARVQARWADPVIRARVAVTVVG